MNLIIDKKLHKYIIIFSFQYKRFKLNWKKNANK